MSHKWFRAQAAPLRVDNRRDSIPGCLDIDSNMIVHKDNAHSDDREHMRARMKVRMKEHKREEDMGEDTGKKDSRHLWDQDTALATGGYGLKPTG